MRKTVLDAECVAIATELVLCGCSGGKAVIGFPVCLRYYVNEGEEVTLMIPQLKLKNAHGGELVTTTCQRYPWKLANLEKPKKARSATVPQQ